MSTIPLLPPERSHICIAFGSALWAQALAGSGVGAAAAALADGAAADGAADAGAAEAVDAPADTAALGAEDDVPVLQAAITSIATIARAGSLRCFLIQSSSNRPASRAAGLRPTLLRSGLVALYHL